MLVLGIDVGGSGIKGALVNSQTGSFQGDRIRIDTPSSFEFDAVTQAIAGLVAKFDHSGPIGVGFPSVVARGAVLTPPTAHEAPGWVNRRLDTRLQEMTGLKVTALNDADAAGLAEMRFGAGKGENGVVITITLGTGVGSGLFQNGNLVPNLEIGKIFLPNHNEVVEQYMAGRIRKEKDLSWKAYGKRLKEFCLHVEQVFSPGLLIIGGGISKKHEKFLPAGKLKRTRVVPAELLNNAGIVGAALWASETTPRQQH